MYAVARHYTNAKELFDELARRQDDIRNVIETVPGFISYYLIRAGDGGMSVTVCRDKAGAEESTRRAGDWVRQNVPAAAGAPPQVTEGVVLYGFHAS